MDLDRWDEAFSPDGFLRASWKHFSHLIEGPSASELMSGRMELIRRNLEELGVTYNVYADSQGVERPWQLDAFPLTISEAEWKPLERGLAQRTRLFNAILNDIYGPRSLLAKGLLPSSLILGNPAFLRPCDGIRAPASTPLMIHGINLARRPDGSWCVVSDRTQCPSGLGYALANRIVLSRAMPDEFRSAQVVRLASFFMNFRDALRALVPHSDSPSIALLTPGPYNETYFEHTFLARYMGLTLVEGGDLTIRDERVFIKTLEGLKPVDVLIRRVDDSFSDPLELRSDSCLGVPGLLNAVRTGKVALLNSLGSNIMESPGLNAFLPELCRHLLGEDLLIPSVQTSWCGYPDERARLFQDLDSRVLKRAHAGVKAAHVFGSKLDEAGRRQLAQTLAFSPEDYVAQERVPLSRMPVFKDGKRASCPIVLRSFVCAGPNGTHVLPGGLTRVSTSGDGMVVSMQSGSMSKDTWILSETPVANVSLLRPATQVIRLERAPAEVPSRVADNLFWLGRYAERLEDITRVLRCVLFRLTSESGSEETPEVAALVSMLVKLDLFPERFLEKRTLAGIERECVQFIFQSHRLGTIREVHGRLQSLSFSLKDRFSTDTQRILSRLQHRLRPSENNTSALGALDVLNDIILHLAAFSGLEMENMTRGHGWRFLDMGRRLERAINCITLLQAGLETRKVHGTAALGPILEIADSSMTFRRRYFGHPEWPTVADLLVADESNPRSFAFQVSAMIDHVQRLPGDRAGENAGREIRQLVAVRRMLAQLDLPDLTEGEREASTDPLFSTLSRIAGDMCGISDSVTQRFFAHTPLKST